MTHITLTEEDMKRLIKEKLAKDNATTLLEKVVNEQSFSKNMSKSNHCSSEGLDQLIQHLSSELDTQQDNVEKMIQLSQLLVINGEYDSSYSNAGKILELDDKNKDAYLIRAKISFDWKSYKDSLEDLNIAISLSQESKEVVDKITDHFKQDPNSENILMVEVPEELRELLEFRDLILSKIHNSMNIYG